MPAAPRTPPRLPADRKRRSRWPRPAGCWPRWGRRQRLCLRGTGSAINGRVPSKWHRCVTAGWPKGMCATRHTQQVPSPSRCSLMQRPCATDVPYLAWTAAPAWHCCPCRRPLLLRPSCRPQQGWPPLLVAAGAQALRRPRPAPAAPAPPGWRAAWACCTSGTCGAGAAGAGRQGSGQVPESVGTCSRARCRKRKQVLGAKYVMRTCR